MMMINPGATIIAIVCCIGVYLLMHTRRMNARWSDMRRGILIFLARSSIYKLSESTKNARTWRPNMLVLSGSPTSRWYLVELADAITHGKGFLTVASILTQTQLAEEKVQSLETSVKNFLAKQNIPALVKVKCADDFVSAVEGLVTDYGLGTIEPNTIIFGDTEKEENLVDFSQIIKFIYYSKKNLVVIKEHSKDSHRHQTPGDQKTIDVWWGRQHDNASLMLVLAYMLQTSPEWMGSTLNLKSLVKSEEERQGVQDNLLKFIEEGRFQANVQVYVGSEGKTPFENINRFSQNADLVFIGMRPPGPDESAEEYSGYYEELLEHTNRFPLTAITLAGENVEFQEIFL